MITVPKKGPSDIYAIKDENDIELTRFIFVLPGSMNLNRVQIKHKTILISDNISAIYICTLKRLCRFKH